MDEEWLSVIAMPATPLELDNHKRIVFMKNTYFRWSHVRTALVLLLGLVITLPLRAEVYKTNAVFLKENVGAKIESPKPIWLRGAVKEKIETILAHPYKKLRVKYWGTQQKTVWILEEVGKEKPITTGIVIADNKIVKVEILSFRESRGWEVKYPVFLRQFIGTTLKDNNQLTTNIDGITGATLSVRAVTKLAKMALFLHTDVVNR